MPPRHSSVTGSGWWEAVLDLVADPLSDAVEWPPQCHVDVAIIESLMSYHVGSLGIVRSVIMLYGMLYFLLFPSVFCTVACASLMPCCL